VNHTRRGDALLDCFAYLGTNELRMELTVSETKAKSLLMAYDNLSIFDVEHVILTGEIKERQKDRDTGEWKYLVEGETIVGDLAVVVAKLSITNKLVMITVYVV
jgi:hypothetical protein